MDNLCIIFVWLFICKTFIKMKRFPVSLPYSRCWEAVEKFAG